MLFIGGVLVLAGLAGIVMRHSWRERFRRHERSWVNRVREGSRVRLAGRLRARERPLLAPVSEVACLYYKVVVLEAKSDDAPTEVFRETELAEDWVFDDESGSLSVDPTGAVIETAEGDEYTPGGSLLLSQSPIPPAAASRYLYFDRGDRGSLTLREWRLQVGAPVVLLGRVERDAGGLKLGGGPELRVLEGTEKELLSFSMAEGFAWLLLVVGLLVCGSSLLEKQEDFRPPPPVPLRPAPTPARP